jgi:hypothetical protein
MSHKLKLLLLAANSVDTVDSRSTEEIQAIDRAIQAALHREMFEIKKEPALRISDIGPLLLKHNPDILHISGHSRKTKGLILENEHGRVAKVTCARLKDVLLSAGSNLQVVFFGFCHSGECVEETSMGINFVLGIEGEISVNSSLTFAPAFYGALASGQSIQQAVEYGKSELRLKRRGGSRTILLKVRDGADATKSFIKPTTHTDDLKSDLERLIDGAGSRMDWSNLQTAMSNGVLVISQQETEGDNQKEDSSVSLIENSEILYADLPGDIYRRVRAILQPTPPGIAPPFRPAVFVGREEALSDIRQLLTVRHGSNRENLTVIHGWPGVGKTSLVSAIGHDPEIATLFKDGVLWVSLEQKPNVISEMARWGRALGSEAILSAVTVNDATAQLAALLRKRNMLLIVDDVWETSHAAPFSGAAGEQCSVMITTRLPLVADGLTINETQLYTLPVLTDKFALMVLRILVPDVVAENEDGCLQLVQDLECLPLALHVAAGLLRSEARLGWGVSALIERIREGTEIINKQAPKDRIEKDGFIPSVSALLHRSTDVLDEETREHFASLAAFAPKPATFDLAALQAIWLVDDPKPIVRQLVGHGLLEHVGRRRFQMHRILVDHARSLCTED